MCHDINPLGTTMHLRELDRQAARLRASAIPAPDFRGQAGQHGGLGSRCRLAWSLILLRSVRAGRTAMGLVSAQEKPLTPFLR